MPKSNFVIDVENRLSAHFKSVDLSRRGANFRLANPNGDKIVTKTFRAGSPDSVTFVTPSTGAFVFLETDASVAFVKSADLLNKRLPKAELYQLLQSLPEGDLVRDTAKAIQEQADQRTSEFVKCVIAGKELEISSLSISPIDGRLELHVDVKIAVELTPEQKLAQLDAQFQQRAQTGKPTKTVAKGGMPVFNPFMPFNPFQIMQQMYGMSNQYAPYMNAPVSNGQGDDLPA